MTRKRRPQWHAIAPYTPHREPPQTNPQPAAAILEIVDTQLRDGTPPENRQTFDRLVVEGYTPEGARQLLAHVVVREIFTASWPNFRTFLPSLIFRPTFRSFVLANFAANNIAAQPILYRRV